LNGVISQKQQQIDAYLKEKD
jgi:hypothetical protein